MPSQKVVIDFQFSLLFYTVNIVSTGVTQQEFTWVFDPFPRMIQLHFFTIMMEILELDEDVELNSFSLWYCGLCSLKNSKCLFPFISAIRSDRFYKDREKRWTGQADVEAYDNRLTTKGSRYSIDSLHRTPAKAPLSFPGWGSQAEPVVIPEQKTL